MVSLLILSSLIVVMVGVIPSTILGVRQAGERVAAATLIRQTFERLQSSALANIYDVTYDPVQINNVEYLVSVEARRAVGSNGDPLEETAVKDVTVTVRWTSRQGRQTLRSRTWIARPQ